MPYRTAPSLAIEDVIVDHGRRLATKRALDIVLSIFLLIPAAILVASSAILIRLTSRGPIFYKQTRLGLLGRPFHIWKLRSMIHECELTSGVCWSSKKDPRVTPIGRFLRKTHLDELPQLINVLKGEMSLVGPRPERPELIPILESSISHYRRRLLVRPGVTGLAQVYLPPDTSISSVRKKLSYDLHYVQNLGIVLDLRLMVATGLQVIGLSPAFVLRLLRLPQAEAIEQRTVPEFRFAPMASVEVELHSFEIQAESAV